MVWLQSKGHTHILVHTHIHTHPAELEVIPNFFFLFVFFFAVIDIHKFVKYTCIYKVYNIPKKCKNNYKFLPCVLCICCTSWCDRRWFLVSLLIQNSPPQAKVVVRVFPFHGIIHASLTCTQRRRGPACTRGRRESASTWLLGTRDVRFWSEFV